METVSRPSYTVGAVAGILRPLPFPGGGCRYSHQHAAIRYVPGSCSPSFCQCSRVPRTLPASPVDQMASRRSPALVLVQDPAPAAA
jgi:hypothetical protein